MVARERSRFRPGFGSPLTPFSFFDRLFLDRVVLVEADESRDDAVVRLNRAVALAEVAGPTAALAEIEGLTEHALESFLPYHAVRADTLRRLGRIKEARAAYDAALALGPAAAERLWLARRKDSLPRVH